MQGHNRAPWDVEGGRGWALKASENVCGEWLWQGPQGFLDIYFFILNTFNTIKHIYKNYSMVVFAVGPGQSNHMSNPSGLTWTRGFGYEQSIQRTQVGGDRWFLHRGWDGYKTQTWSEPYTANVIPSWKKGYTSSLGRQKHSQKVQFSR